MNNTFDKELDHSLKNNSLYQDKNIENYNSFNQESIIFSKKLYMENNKNILNSTGYAKNINEKDDENLQADLLLGKKRKYLDEIYSNSENSSTNLNNFNNFSSKNISTKFLQNNSFNSSDKDDFKKIDFSSNKVESDIKPKLNQSSNNNTKNISNLNDQKNDSFEFSRGRNSVFKFDETYDSEQNEKKKFSYPNDFVKALTMNNNIMPMNINMLVNKTSNKYQINNGVLKKENSFHQKNFENNTEDNNTSNPTYYNRVNPPSKITRFNYDNNENLPKKNLVHDNSLDNISCDSSPSDINKQNQNVLNPQNTSLENRKNSHDEKSSPNLDNNQDSSNSNFNINSNTQNNNSNLAPSDNQNISNQIFDAEEGELLDSSSQKGKFENDHKYFNSSNHFNNMQNNSMLSNTNSKTNALGSNNINKTTTNNNNNSGNIINNNKFYGKNSNVKNNSNNLNNSTQKNPLDFCTPNIKPNTNNYSKTTKKHVSQYYQNSNIKTNESSNPNLVGNFANFMNLMPNFTNIQNIPPIPGLNPMNSNLNPLTNFGNINQIPIPLNQMNNFMSSFNPNMNFPNQNIYSQNNPQPNITLQKVDVFLNDNLLKIEFSAKTDKFYNSLKIHNIITPDVFQKIYTRDNFLTENNSIYNLTSIVDSDCSDTMTRKFYLDFTEKSFFGLIKYEKSFFIIFSAKNKIMHNSLGENVFCVFIINDYNKILLLEENKKDPLNFKEIRVLSDNLNNSNEKSYNNTEILNKLKSHEKELEKKEKGINDLKKQIENEKRIHTDTKITFENLIKKVKTDKKEAEIKSNEINEKIRNLENYAKDLEAQNKTLIEKCRGMELEKIFNNKLKNQNINKNILRPNNINNNKNLGAAVKKNTTYKPIGKTAKKILSNDNYNMYIENGLYPNDIVVELDESEGYNTHNCLHIKEEFSLGKTENNFIPNEDLMIEEIGNHQIDISILEMNSRISELNSKLENFQCVICLSKNRDCLFEDCGHLSSCYECMINEIKRLNPVIYAKIIKNDKSKFKFVYSCPICKKENKNFMKIMIP